LSNLFRVGEKAVPVPNQCRCCTLTGKGVRVRHGREFILVLSRIKKPKKKTKLHGLSPRPNYTDRATAACRRSDYQLLRIEGRGGSVTDPYGHIVEFPDRSRYFSISSSFVLTRLSGPCSKPKTFFSW
jgi:hypothetical protein